MAGACSGSIVVSDVAPPPRSATGAVAACRAGGSAPHLLLLCRFCLEHLELELEHLDVGILLLLVVGHRSGLRRRQCLLAAATPSANGDRRCGSACQRYRNTASHLRGEVEAPLHRCGCDCLGVHVASKIGAEDGAVEQIASIRQNETMTRNSAFGAERKHTNENTDASIMNNNIARVNLSDYHTTCIATS